MKIKIYSGLSVKRETVRKVLPGAVFCGPVARGDLYSDIHDKTNVIGIVDGKFMQSLAVSPTEIMDALRCGIRVYGASSIGALRAVEMRNHGMIGCGEIYRHVLSQAYFRDDQLGLIFYDSSNRRPNLPHIDLLFSVTKAVEQKKLDRSLAQLILKSYEQIYFADRNWFELERKLMVKRPSVHWSKILKNLSVSVPYQKTLDASEMLFQIRDDLKMIEKLNRQFR